MVVVNTPAVQANQSGPWTVSLSGPVKVPPLQPLQLSCRSRLSFRDNINECVVTPPAGKRFVVQTISIHIDVDPGVRVSEASVNSFDASGGATSLWLNIPFTGSFPCACGDISQLTQDVHLYVDGGTNLVFELLFNTDTNNNNLIASAIGYLVDM